MVCEHVATHHFTLNLCPEVSHNRQIRNLKVRCIIRTILQIESKNVRKVQNKHINPKYEIVSRYIFHFSIFFATEVIYNRNYYS